MSSNQINIQDLWKYDLRRGSSDHPRHGACLFDAGMWLVYGKIGDNPPCSCPIIRPYAIALNDRMPNNERQKLKPFILRVVGNRDPESEELRKHFIILETARKVVPKAFDEKWPSLAAKARAIPDNATYADIKQVMQELANAADADATAAAANAAAYAAYAAAANAAAYAAAAYAAAWDQAIWILDNVLKIGKQSPEYDEEKVIKSIKQFETASRLP